LERFRHKRQNYSKGHSVKKRYTPKKNVMDERCVAMKDDGTVCGSPPTLRDLMGGDGMTITPDGPVCADCYLKTDLQSPDCPGFMAHATDQPLLRSHMPESIERGKHAEFIGPAEKEQIDKKMKEMGLHRSRRDLMADFFPVGGND
jgi:hypothetical protein